MASAERPTRTRDTSARGAVDGHHGARKRRPSAHTLATGTDGTASTKAALVTASLPGSKSMDGVNGAQHHRQERVPLASRWWMLPLHVFVGVCGLAAACVIMCIRATLGGCNRIRRLVFRTPPAAKPLRSVASSPRHPETGITGVVDVVDVAGIRTELMTWDGHNPGGDPLYFIMLPGNPGAVEFYGQYLQRVYEGMNKRMTVVCLGHASHSVRTASRERFNLQAQVEHKQRFLDELLSRNPRAKIVLAGHSVGAYMVLEAMRKMPTEAVPRAILLFPTIMNIGATINGRTLMPAFRWLRWAAWAAVHALSVLPEAWQRAIAWRFMQDADEASLDAALSLMHPEVAYNALWMALHEMLEITHLDDEHMRSVQERCVLYFGREDGWVNESDADFIQRRYTGATTIRCAEGHKHAFVLSPESSTRMAELTCTWLRPALT